MNQNQATWLPQVVTNLHPLALASENEWRNFANTNPQQIAAQLGWDVDTFQQFRSEHGIATLRRNFISQLQRPPQIAPVSVAAQSSAQPSGSAYAAQFGYTGSGQGPDFTSAGSSSQTSMPFPSQVAAEEVFKKLNFPLNNAQLRGNLWNMWFCSPALRNVVQAAISGGPIRIVLEERRTETDRGYWWSKNRTIVVKKAPAETYIIFEMINAANDYQHQQLDQKMENGAYEQDQYRQPIERIQAARQYAREVERVEWEGARTHYVVCSELLAGGIPISDDFNVPRPKFERGQDGLPAPWEEFDGYLREQIESGHTQHYIDQYMEASARHSIPVATMQPTPGPQPDSKPFVSLAAAGAQNWRQGQKFHILGKNGQAPKCYEITRDHTAGSFNLSCKRI
jgi:hypothetical protein